MSDYGRAVFTGQIKDLEFQLEYARKYLKERRTTIRGIKKSLRRARRQLKDLQREEADPDRFPHKFYKTMVRTTRLEKLREKLEENMRLYYYLATVKEVAVKDFARSFVVIGAAFLFLFVWHMFMGLLFSNLWGTLFIFSAIVAWGTYFSYSDRHPAPKKAAYVDVSRRYRSAAARALEEEEAPEEEILGA